jgi:hypothetical protein
MKKILSISLVIAVLAVAFTGCLKDKGFDNGTYGINDPDTQPPGVGFPFGSKTKNDWGLDVTSTNQPVTGLVYVNLEAGALPKSDIKITLADNSAAMVTAYNAANGTNIQVLPAAIWNVLTSLTIPAGGRNIEVPLNVTSTLALNSALQYAVGLRISAVDGGYTIAENLRNLFIVFSVKNKYDGKYTMKGRFYHPSVNPGFDAHSFTVELRTAGPNDVTLYWPLYGGFYTPLNGAGGAPTCCFTAQTLGLATNPGTNVTTAYNADPAFATSYSTMTSTGSLPSFPVPTPNRWVDATKTFYISFGYNLSGGSATAGTSRCWIDTLQRTGPR